MTVNVGMVAPPTLCCYQSDLQMMSSQPAATSATGDDRGEIERTPHTNNNNKPTTTTRHASPVSRGLTTIEVLTFITIPFKIFLWVLLEYKLSQQDNITPIS